MARLGRNLFEEMSRRLLTGEGSEVSSSGIEDEGPEVNPSVAENGAYAARQPAAKSKTQLETQPCPAAKCRPGELQVAHLALAVLCCWTPADSSMEAYCRERQEIFDALQPYFQPAAISLVTETDQKEYLLERDFLAYRAQDLVRDWEDPVELLIHLLKRRRRGNLKDAHMVFRGEQGLVTEEIWDPQRQKMAARRAVRLLARYADMEDCCFLLGEGETL